MTPIFTLKPHNPEKYRQQTRRSTILISVLFIVLAMILASLSSTLFGTPGGDNFHWTLGGVLVALVITLLIARGYLWNQPFMAEAVYGWQLKRNLLRVTNIMHNVEAGVAAGDTTAMLLLRFYHLGLIQMHDLDANTCSLNEVSEEINQLAQKLDHAHLDKDQQSLYQEWLDAVKLIPAPTKGS